MANENLVMPEGKIVLTNGYVLECFPKSVQPDVIRTDDLRLDDSGVYFQTKRHSKEKSKEDNAWQVLFLKEAFFLHENSGRILSDSRMFLTPTPFQNNLAYSGTSGLDSATLGVYIEWWKACEKAVIIKDGEVEALTYFFAGSPLTGTNSCSAVDRDGKVMKISFPGPFYDIWEPFMKINTRYTEAKQRYQAYTLEETVAILHGSIDQG